MHYLGSKSMHAKEILAVTLAERKLGQTYVEPFVGGGNIINKVPAEQGPRIANDLNEGMVALLDSLGNKGWTPPPEMTQAEWKEIMKRKIDTLDWEGKALYAFAATGPTFGSMWAGAWAKKPGYYKQAVGAALRDIPGLQGIEFHSGPYDAFPFPDQSIVYCDPPYSGTVSYAGSKKKIAVDESLEKNRWKPAAFWRWCDDLVIKRGCSVFVSEYRGPEASAFPSQPSADWLARDAAFKALPKLDPQDRSIATSVFEERLRQRQALDEEKNEAAVAYAAKWAQVWEKQVAVNISGGTVADGEIATRKVERLFHREP